MISTRMKWMVLALALGAAAWMLPGLASADMVGPLVECQSVSQPAVLTTCASTQDPLTAGNVVLDDQGNLDVVLVGAAETTSYSIIFRSVDGTHTIPLGTISTGAGGNGNKSKYAALPFEKDAAGFIVLQRNSGDQYVTSLFVRGSSSDTTRASFHVDLMACGAVNDPDPIASCGTDAFKSGSVDVNSDTGDYTIQVNGAEVGVTYNVELRSPNGGATFSLGTVGPTGTNGDATATGTISPSTNSTIEVGTIVLTRNSADQAYGGVRVTEKQPKSPEEGAHLVKCDAINYPAGATPSGGLETCGSDPLTGGTASLSQSGTLSVSVSGAATGTSYEVFFRPVDTTGSADVDTGIAVKTGSNGNGHGSGALGSSGDIGAGTFVVKNAGTDEFFSGFSIK
jgi:hypothetical protein